MTSGTSPPQYSPHRRIIANHEKSIYIISRGASRVHCFVASVIGGIHLQGAVFMIEGIRLTGA